jgi:hypothetical protein
MCASLSQTFRGADRMQRSNRNRKHCENKLPPRSNLWYFIVPHTNKQSKQTSKVDSNIHIGS